MKRILLFHLSFLLVSAVPMQNGIAQSYTRWGLPAGAAARLGKGEITRTGNISYSPDGTKLAVASSQGVWIYDTRIGTEIRLLTNRRGAATSLAFSPDGRTLASGEYYDRSTLLWDVDTGMLKTSLEGHPVGYQRPIFLEFSSNGRTLVSGSGNASVRLWDVTTGQFKHLETDKFHTSLVHKVAFSPDGTILAGAMNQSSSDPSYNIDEIRFWDSITGEHEATIFGVGAVFDLAFSPDGETIASASHKWDEVDQQNEYPIKLWDVSTKKLRLILEGDLDYANSIKFSPDSKTLASGSEYGEISFWDTTTGRQKLKIEAHEHYVISVDYSPYGGTLASVGGDQLIRFWDSATGNHKLIISGHTDGIYSVDFSKDGKTLASGSYLGSIRFWDVEKARLRQTISDLGYGVRLSYSPDGEILASINEWDDQTVEWDGGVKGAATVKLWDADTGHPKHECSLGPEPWSYAPSGYASLSFSPDGNSIAAGLGIRTSGTGTGHSKVWVWDVSTGEFKFSVGEERGAWPPGHSDIRCVSYSPDGEKLVAGSKIYNSTNGNWEHRFVNLDASAIAFSPDGATLAVGTGGGHGARDGMIQLWDFRRRLHKTDLVEPGFPDPNPQIFTLEYSPDGKTLASGSGDGIVRLYDIETGEERQTLEGHTFWVWSIAYSPDGSLLASGSMDGTILIWDSIHEFYEEDEEPPEPPKRVEDVNLDGVVDIADLVLVAKQFGQLGKDRADVNGDRIVDIVDLLLVAEAFGNAAAAPSAALQSPETLTAAKVQQWLIDAKSLDNDDTRAARGIVVLEQLLASLTATEAIPAMTTLLPNYPNPFNPETWIPYHLARDADVTLTIYDAQGVLVRRLDLGHQRSGFYTERAKAVHWDGRNEMGELVASGVYTYQFRAGGYVALRRMVILK